MSLYLDIDEGQIDDSQHFLDLTRVSFGLVNSLEEGEEKKAERNGSERSGQRETRVEPCVCAMDHHPYYKGVVEQMRVGEEFPFPMPHTLEREGPH